MSTERLTPAALDQYRRFSTCIVASAIETFDVRLRNAGFADSSVRCIFRELPPVVGYAATARIQTSEPPMEGHSYYRRTDWWNHLLSIPEPRIVVIEDIDKRPGFGAFMGEVHANILQALGCVGFVTNGAVRDLPAVKAIGFQLFAGEVSVSHAYAHVFDFGGTVRIGGLKVEPGDLIQGDLHGVLSIPLEIASQVPAKALEIAQRRERLIQCCRGSDFSVAKLRETLKEMES
jgi:4-hydroxy-4-methyl-2-oxoglutarate aldolase